MKKIMIGICLVLISKFTNAQNGLEKIIVEKYYVSNAADAAGSVGTLPVGSVTYRIFADMLPGYKFQALYGVLGHELRFQTTTSFFNNEDRGHITPSYTITQAATNTVMLDSWLSVGGACGINKLGILKSEDNGVSTVVNVNGILQNNDPTAGIPLTSQDGFISGTPQDVTLVGFDPPNTDLEVFNATSNAGNLFSNSDGSIASLSGSIGPTTSNRVLIAQLTTDGLLSFELNIQIGTPGGGVQNFVAKNPVGNEIQLPSLTFKPVSLNLKAFIQGFYIGGGLMNALIYNLDQQEALPNPLITSDMSDYITISAMEVAPPHNLVDAKVDTLRSNGDVNVTFGPAVVANTSYYIKVDHRNSVETWSANPVPFLSTTSYTFSTPNQSYGPNMAEVEPGIWAIYTGEVEKDGAVDISDFLALDPSIQAGDGGYLPGDLNGDGSVDITDFLILDPNVQLGLGANPVP